MVERPNGEENRLTILETTRWELHLRISLEIAVSHAKEKGPVDYWLFERADTSRLEAVSELLRPLQGLSFYKHLSKFSAQGSLMRRFERYVQERQLPINCHFVPKADWDSRNIDQLNISHAELDNLVVNGLSAGPYIFSSLVWSARDSIPRERPWLLRALARKFFNLTQFQRQILTARRPDAALIFNGRFVENGPAVGLCRELGIPIRFHERSTYTPGRYFYEDYRPHDFGAQARKATELWSTLSHEERQIAIKQSQEFLQAHSSTRGLSQGVVQPKKIDGIPPKTSKPRAVFFSSTETEFVFDEISPESAFPSQIESIQALADVCTDLGWELIIRVHPNVSELSRAERTRWNQSLTERFPLATVLGSESGVDSDRLLSTADLIVVLRSSMAVQSVYLGKPTLTLGETIYEGCGVDVQRVHSRQELHELMRNFKELTVDPSSVFPFVHYLTSYGKQLKYLNSEEFRLQGLHSLTSLDSVRKLLFKLR